MSHLESKEINYVKFRDKYLHDWREGNITTESVDELISILDNLNIDNSISSSIYWKLERLVRLLIRYRFDRDCQSIHWIEPIRMESWSLHHWIEVYPELADYKYDIDKMESHITYAFYFIYDHDDYLDHTTDEFRMELAKEFTIKNLGDIDYIENYLKTYATNSKVKRYLQII